jgi:hypothetical protein
MSFHQTISKSIVLARKTAAGNGLGQVTIFNLIRLSSSQKIVAAVSLFGVPLRMLGLVGFARLIAI